MRDIRTPARQNAEKLIRSFKSSYKGCTIEIFSDKDKDVADGEWSASFEIPTPISYPISLGRIAKMV